MDEKDKGNKNQNSGKQQREPLMSALAERKRAGMDVKQIKELRTIRNENIVTGRLDTARSPIGMMRLQNAFGAETTMFIDSDPFDAVVWYDTDPLSADTTISTIDMTDSTDP